MEKSGSSQKKGRIFYGYWIVLSLILILLFSVSFFSGCLSIFIPEVAASLSTTSATIGYIVSVYALSNSLLMPLFGRLFHKYDVRIMCTIGALALVVALLLQSMVTEPWQFIACGVLDAAGIAPLMFLAPATLVNRWFTKRAGFLIGLVLAFTGVGGMIWNPIGELIIGALGWRVTYRIFALAAACVTLPLTIFVLRNDPSEKGLRPFGEEEAEAEAAAAAAAAGASEDGSAAAEAPAPELPGMTAHDAYRTPMFKLMLFYVFFLNLGMYTNTMIPSYVGTLSFAVGMPLLGATCASIAMGAQMAGKIGWGALGDRKPMLSVSCGILLGIASVLSLALLNGSPWMVYGGALMYGLYFATTTVMNPILTRRFFGMKEYSIVFSKITMMATFGTFSASLIWGTVINVTSSYYPMFFGVACVLTASFICIHIANRCFISRRKKEEAAQSAQ